MPEKITRSNIPERVRAERAALAARVLRKNRKDLRRFDIPTDKYLLCPSSFVRNQIAHAVRIFRRKRVIANCDRCKIDLRFRGQIWEAGDAPSYGLNLAEATYCVNYVGQYLDYCFAASGSGKSLGYSEPDDEVDLTQDAIFFDLNLQDMVPTGKYIICPGSFLRGGIPHGAQIFKHKQARALCRVCGIACNFKGAGYFSGLAPAMGMSLEDATQCVNFLKPFIQQIKGVGNE